MPSVACRAKIGVVLAVLVLVSLTGATRAWAGFTSCAPRWTKLTNGPQPPARKHHTFVIDSYANQAILWSGEAGSTLLDYGYVWILDLATLQWRQVATSATNPGAPDDATSLDGQPRARHGHCAVMLPEQRKMIMMTGSTDASSSLAVQGDAATKDVWELDLSNPNDPKWTNITPAGGDAPCRRWHSAAVARGSTSAGATIFLFGGHTNTNPWAEDPDATTSQPPLQTNDTWILQQSGTSTSWGWSIGTALGVACAVPTRGPDLPDRRYKHSLITTPGCSASGLDELFVFGGPYFEAFVESNVHRGTYPHNQLVEWDGAYHSEVTGSQHSRSEHSAILDPIECRMVVFGGFLNRETELTPVSYLSAMRTQGGCANSACWSDLGATVSTPPSARPSARYGHAGIYDPRLDRMIVFGGSFGGPPATEVVTNETWVLSLGRTPDPTPIVDLHVEGYTSQEATLRWTHAGTPAQGAPETWGYQIRSSASPIISDCDFAAATPVSAQISWTLVGGTQWQGTVTFTVPNPGSLTYYAIRPLTGPPVVSGISNYVCLRLTPPMLCMDDLRTEMETIPSGLSLSLSTPNPATSSFECTVSIPGTGPVTLRVMDIAGRSIEHHEIAASNAGTRVQRIGARSMLKPGFYMVVLRQGAIEIRRPVIVR